jgi:hypothetical protein
MKTKFLILICLAFVTLNLFAQNQQKGYIIEIEGTSIYVDYTSKDVKVGDRLQVVSEPKVMVHPVTKQKIIKEGELIATLEITETQNDYSVAGKVIPSNAIVKLKVGDKVASSGKTVAKELPKDGKVNVAIADATVNDVVGTGYFGNYVADLLMAEMMNCDKIRLIDRSMLNAQIDETNLVEGGYINASNSIMKGQIAGVQYMIQLTMQRPDVTNITTGIPIKSLLTAAGAIAGMSGANHNVTNSLAIGGAMSSNMRTAKLKAAVSLTARVVDVQTGEVLFMCTGTGNAQGDSQLELEEGALGGLQINGGVDGFKQTVTGKAVAMAYRKIGIGLKSYFNGETTEKVIKGGLLDTEMTWRKGKVFMGVNKLSKSEIKEAFSENSQLYFDFRRGNNKKKLGLTMTGLGTVGFSYLFIAGAGAIIDDIRIGQKISDDAYILALSVPFGVIGTFGYLIQKSGTLKIKQSINAYNTNLHKTSYKAEYNVGLTPGGLALTITF